MITQSKVFRSVARAVVPAMHDFNEAGWQRVGSVVERALAQRPPKVRRQLGMFLHVLNLAALSRTGRPLSKLSAEQCAHYLQVIEHSRVMLLRRGFWGLRTLILIGYYTRPEAKVEIGYRANAAGWQARQ